MKTVRTIRVPAVTADFLLPKYADAIRELPAGPISLATLAERFTLYHEDRVRIVYAPFDFMNATARVVIVGITPGLSQAQIAFESVRAALIGGKSIEQAAKEAKTSASFAGPMRSNLCSMLDTIGLPAVLEIPNTAALFDQSADLLHCTSVIRYPVFVNDHNYGGSNPYAWKHPALLAYIENVLAAELEAVAGSLIVPLGKAAERAIRYLVWSHRLDERRCLIGLPHPSGGNGHRVGQFNQQRGGLKRQLNDWRELVEA